MVGFESQRLRFRELRQSDLPLAQSMFNDYNFQENGGVDYTIPRGTDFIENWARWAKSCLIFVIIEEKVNGTFLGFTALNMPIVRNRDADFTIGILESEWGKGYGTEAARWMVDYGFRGLNVHRISLTVTETNDSAVSVYKKVYVVPVLPLTERLRTTIILVALWRKGESEEQSGLMENGWTMW